MLGQIVGRVTGLVTKSFYLDAESSNPILLDNHYR